jgi:hypothetical protein
MTPRVSIVVPNFNYSDFLPACLESALDQTVPCEVVVVDDGSTDGSADVIAAFQARGLHAIFQEHRGQTAAVNAGFEASTGDIVIFLDADDVLDRGVAEVLSRRWHAGAAKAQFRLDAIDDAGRSLGYQFPNYEANEAPARLRERALRTGQYLWPPSSGNAHARRFLSEVMPLPSDRFPHAPDGVLNTIAPLYGDVLTIDAVLGRYRIHARSQQHSVGLTERLARNLGLMRAETEFLYERAATLGIHIGTACGSQMRLLELRMAMVLIGPGQRWGADTRRSLLRLMAATSKDRTLRAWGQAAWMIAAAIAPQPMREAVVRLRFEPHRRPRLIARLLSVVR